MLNFRLSMKSESESTVGLQSRQSFSTPKLKSFYGVSAKQAKERGDSAQAPRHKTGLIS